MFSKRVLISWKGILKDLEMKQYDVSQMLYSIPVAQIRDRSRVRTRLAMYRGLLMLGFRYMRIIDCTIPYCLHVGDLLQ